MAAENFMKIAVIADIHDNLVNLEKFIGWAKSNDIGEIICCGDVTNAETLQFMADNFSRLSGGQAGTIHLIRGNMEIYTDSEAKKIYNINYLGRFGVIEIGKREIGLCHEPKFIDDVLGMGKKPEIIFYGHTHKPWMENRDGVSIANPGTLGGVFQKASFAVWDSETGFLELKLLENL